MVGELPAIQPPTSMMPVAASPDLRALAAFGPRRIALGFLGTTSAGKSTFVNALLGVALLPSDADELSSGLVTFRHGESLCVATAAAPVGFAANTSWCTSPGEVRARLQALLFAVRDVREHGGPDTNPVVTVDADLSAARAFLDIPSDTSLELIDVPGLRIARDDANGTAIVAALGRCSPVLVVDVTTLSAYEELTAIASCIRQEVGSRIDRICVIVNKIDRLGAEDPNVEAQLGRVRDRLADAIPFGFDLVACSALLLAGATEIATLAATSPANLLGPRPDALRALANRAGALLRDGGGVIRRSLPSRDARRDFDAIECDIEEGRLSEAALRESAMWLAHHAFLAARGEPLLRALQGVVARHEGVRGNRPPVFDVAFRAIVRAFQAMIEADGVVAPEEFLLARSLLDDFARSRGVSLERDPHDGLTQTVQGVDQAAVLEALLRADLSMGERQALVGALLSLAVVDKRIAPGERQLLDLARAALLR